MNFLDTLFSAQTDPYGRDPYREESHQPTAQKWRETFAAKLYRETGDWTIGGYDWHTFGHGYHPALTGSEAIDRYQKIKPTRGHLFTHAAIEHPLSCLTPQLPTYAAITRALSEFPEIADIYIVSFDFSWTFVVTHETSAGLGPFFAEVIKM